MEKYECFECGSEITDGVCTHCEALSGKSQTTGWEPGDRFIYKGEAKGTVLRVDEKRPHRHVVVWDDQDCSGSVELRRGYYQKLPNDCVQHEGAK